jgi:hypothetical protein
MNFDKKVPLKLKKTQMWFGSIISRPIDEDSKMNPISPSGNPMEIEACDFIKPSPTLRPAERIEIYNQQYWWRLLSVLHETFPMVTRLFGYHDFNRMIAIPYLVKYPPNDWSLNVLGNQMESWIQDDYQEDDKQLILDAARIDFAFNDCFCSEQKPLITTQSLPDANDASSLMHKKIYLQPYVRLFELDYDLLEFRLEFLKQEPDYWIDHDFPQLKQEKHYYFLIFRNKEFNIEWFGLSEGEYHLLNYIKSGATIDEACEWLETQGESIYQEATENLHLWLQKWIVRQILSLG